MEMLNDEWWSKVVVNERIVGMQGMNESLEIINGFKGKNGAAFKHSKNKKN